MSILCGFGVKAVGWPPLHFTRTHTLLNNQSRQPTPLAVISTSLSLSPLCFLRPSSFPSLVINPSLGSKKQKIPPSTLFSLCPFLPPMASATKIIQPPSFNFTPNPTATRSPIISLFDPLKTHHHHHKLRLNKPNSARRSTPIAAVSNAVKVKKSQTTASLPNPLSIMVSSIFADDVAKKDRAWRHDSDVVEEETAAAEVVGATPSGE
ncbi:hypothetical protein RHMOL_Rhmol01G0241100 [Rhododendron molle]|uniref:Uncharacterized protein n=1 Tax=Rhododendron molle TaxID=49168 RepID=A0ACC0Q7J0_RHOML|nr:hypothetical protein RHMOL_Rhmol01G0241100 [Rhododendron molle]